jgi:hypothetical protein
MSLYSPFAYTPAPSDTSLWNPARLAAENIHLAPTNRGGDITYHGPGQLRGLPECQPRRAARFTRLPAFLGGGAHRPRCPPLAQLATEVAEEFTARWNAWCFKIAEMPS